MADEQIFFVIKPMHGAFLLTVYSTDPDKYGDRDSWAASSVARAKREATEQAVRRELDVPLTWTQDDYTWQAVAARASVAP